MLSGFSTLIIQKLCTVINIIIDFLSVNRLINGFSHTVKFSLQFPPLGFARSFGMRLTNGERREWIKPIMFSGGLGSIEDTHVKKEEPETGNVLTQCEQ